MECALTINYSLPCRNRTRGSPSGSFAIQRFQMRRSVTKSRYKWATSRFKASSTLPNIFAKYPGLQRNLLGRQGWLRNLRLGLIDYDNLLYLSAYDA